MRERMPMPDTFFAIVSICTAEDVPAAREAAWVFHFIDTWGSFGDKPGKLFQVGLSPTGQAPATHFMCVRHMDRKEVDRVYAYLKARGEVGLAALVNYYESADPILPDHTVKDSLAAHEAKTLSELGLRKIVTEAAATV